MKSTYSVACTLEARVGRVQCERMLQPIASPRTVSENEATCLGRRHRRAGPVWAKKGALPAQQSS